MRLKLNDLALSLLAEIVGLDDLHFGWFEPGEAATLESLRIAQRRYTEKLLAELPMASGRILDVGCGTGVIAAALRDRGLEVEGLTPNPELLARARQRLGPAVPLHETTFEAFRPARPFDAILMAESVQYLNRVRGLRNAAAVLRPGGILLLADVFRMRKLDLPYLTRAGHRYANFLNTARGFGLEVELDRDVTTEVAPTLALYSDLLVRRVVPALDLVARDLRRSAPFITWMIRLVTGTKLQRIRERYLHQDPVTFARYRTYRVMRLRRK